MNRKLLILLLVLFVAVVNKAYAGAPEEALYNRAESFGNIILSNEYLVHQKLDAIDSLTTIIHDPAFSNVSGLEDKVIDYLLDPINTVSSDSTLQAEAVKALAKIPGSEVDRLLGSILKFEESPALTFNSATALIERGNSERIAFTLKDREPYCPGPGLDASIQTLVGVGLPVIPTLDNILQSFAENSTKINTIETLKQLGGKGFSKDVAGPLASTGFSFEAEPTVQAAALNALLTLGRNPEIDKLVEPAIGDERPMIQGFVSSYFSEK